MSECKHETWKEYKYSPELSYCVDCDMTIPTKTAQELSELKAENARLRGEVIEAFVMRDGAEDRERQYIAKLSQAEAQNKRLRVCLEFIWREADFHNRAEEVRIHTAIRKALSTKEAHNAGLERD